MERDEIKEIIKEALEDVFFSEEEYAPFNSLNDKVNKLLNLREYDESLQQKMKYADKFDDYMKNVDKLNMMINEFKGLLAIVRGQYRAVEDKKTF